MKSVPLLYVDEHLLADVYALVSMLVLLTINPFPLGLDYSPSARLVCQKTHSVSPLFFVKKKKKSV